MPRQLLIETMLTECQILEEATKETGGRMRVGCTVCAADEVNENGRVYPEAIQDREVAKINKIIEEGWAYSAADHPADGVSRIETVAARFIKPIKKEIVEGRKLYRTEALILNTQPGGQNLQEMIRTKGKVHLSQRGWGNLVKGDWHGKEADIVQDDYRCKTYDFVIGGSTKGAEVEEQITEQKFNIINLIESGPCEGCPRDCQETPAKGGSRTMDIVKTLEELRKAYPDLCLQLETEVKTKTEKDLKEGLEKEWLAKCNELAAGIEKKIQESEEYKNYVKGMDAHKAVILEIARVVRPYMTEMGEEDDEAEVEDLKKQLEQSKKDNEDLKKKQEKDKADEEAKKKAKDKVSEMTAGKEHGDLIAERLQDCKTVAEVEARFPQEVAYIKRVRGEKATEEEKGKGKVLDENKEIKPEEKEKSLEEQRKDWSPEKIRQRELAGLPV